MPRYNYKDLWNCEVLPEDCNSEAEQYAKQFLSSELMAALATMREKKISNGYGKVIHQMSGNIPEVSFKFRKGICENASPLIRVGDKTIIKGSYQFYIPHLKD
jgi:hypothetical protein